MDDLKALKLALERRAEYHAPSEGGVLADLALGRRSRFGRRKGRVNSRLWLTAGAVAAAVVSIVVTLSLVWTPKTGSEQVAARPLSGTTWVLASVTSNGKTTPVPADLTVYTLKFASSGLLTAGASCVSVTGQWTTTAIGFKLNDAGSPSADCFKYQGETVDHAKLRNMIDHVLFSMNGDIRAESDSDQLHVHWSAGVLNYRRGAG